MMPTKNKLKGRARFDYEREVVLKLAKSSVSFVENMWGLVPQEVKPEFKQQLEYVISMQGEDWASAKDLICAEWFGDYNAETRSYTWYNFQKGKHITWQQYVILLSIDKAVNGNSLPKISIASGHGVGKTSTMSWVILWFLFGRFDSQIPCTAPTATQMYDVLWKELSIWISKMPAPMQSLYEWNKDYIRMRERPNTWFARAKTSSKENSEALAGVHAEWVMTVADEASGVEDQIFNVAEGAWTSGNILVILISNPTRVNGYFYDTHNKQKHNWQQLRFSSIESPVVDPKYEGQIAERHGRDSEEYGIRVLGKFPKEDSMDDSGFVPLLADRDISTYPLLDVNKDIPFKSTSILGVDPAGEGDDKTVFVLRDQLKAFKIVEESVSNSKSIAEKIITLIDKYDLEPRNVVVDAFGVGTTIASEVAIASRGRYAITSVNVGEDCEYESDKELYENKRGFMYYECRAWLKQGGMIVEDKGFYDELLTIRYKRNLRGKIQMMSKQIMKKKYSYSSPNIADAFALTFLRNIEQHDRAVQAAIQEAMDNEDFDPHSPL